MQWFKRFLCKWLGHKFVRDHEPAGIFVEPGDCFPVRNLQAIRTSRLQDGSWQVWYNRYCKRCWLVESNDKEIA